MLRNRRDEKRKSKLYSHFLGPFFVVREIKKRGRSTGSFVLHKPWSLVKKGTRTTQLANGVDLKFKEGKCMIFF